MQKNWEDTFEQRVASAGGAWAAPARELYMDTFGVFRSHGGFRYEQIPRRVCVHVVTAGRGRMIVDGHARAVAGGEMFVFFGGQHIRYFDEPGAPWRYTWFHLRGSGAETVLAEAGVSRDAPHHVLGEGSALLERLPRWERLFFDGTGGPLLPVRAAWEAVEAMVLDRAAGPDRSPPTLAAACRELMEAQYMNPIGVETVARQFGVERTTLYRHFVRAYGVSPKTYLDGLRMERAASLLRNPERTVAEVARACGYADAHYFSRAFRKRYGRAPSARRNRKGKAEGNM